MVLWFDFPRKIKNSPFPLLKSDCAGGNLKLSNHGRGEARIMGYTVKCPGGLDIRKMPDHMVEIHGLTMCTKCSKLIDCAILQEC